MIPFFLNHPPPPLPPRESIINEGIRTFEQPKNDQEWLKNWIKEKRLSSNHISLSNYRQKLIEHAHFLQQYEEALKNSHHEILLDLKNKIQQSNNFIYNENMIKNIQKQIQRRKSKRDRLRRRKSIEKKHVMKEIINEKSLKDKIQEINSILETIEKLKQLTKQSNTTNEQLTELENLCQMKLQEYQNEMKQSLSNYLFNNNNNQSFYESTDPDGQYLLRAHQNINNLIEIRQGWDQYSNKDISSLDDLIPFQWHEPQQPSDSNWSQYIFNS